MQFKTVTLLIASCVLAHVALAQNETPDQFCKRQNANFKPVFEADGSFNGACEMDDGKVCLGDEFTTPKGSVLCCMGGTVMAVDSATREAACCAKGKIYKNWACSDPAPAITCPAWNGKMVTQNGINFQVWCQRNIIEYTDPFDWSGKFAALSNMNKQGTATFQDCLDVCASDSRCQGVNWWYGKGQCAPNNFKQGGSIFSRGGRYENPPPVAWLDRNVIALVAVPMR